MRLPRRTRHVRDAVESAETNGYIKGHKEAWWKGYAQALLDFPSGGSPTADIAARIDAGPNPQRLYPPFQPSGRPRSYVARRTPTGHVLQLVSPTSTRG